MAKGQPNPYSSDYIDSETGNWNNAKAFSIGKIVTYLFKIDEYRMICEHGADELVNEIMMDDNLKTKARVNALYRLIKTTQMLISNSMFALKRGDDRNAVIKYSQDLKNLEKLHPLCKKEIVKQSPTGSIREIKINEEVFGKILNILNTINEELLYPLNRADLIFKGSEDEDPWESKQRIMAEFSGDID